MQLPKELVKVENDMISINTKDIKIWVILGTVDLYVDINEYNKPKLNQRL